jgi:ATP-binding cassette subfamily F protein 3
MELVRFQQVKKDYGHIEVLHDVSFKVTSGRKLGLIGPNGSGKTSILRMLVGEEPPSGGVIVAAQGVRIGYVPQHVEHPPDATVLDTALGDHLGLERSLREHEEALAAASSNGLDRALEAYEHAREEYERAGGERTAKRAAGMLDSLGLAGRAESRVGELSGGEKNVLTLVRALLAEPELLLLDEPDNHLDFEGVAWLESFLQGYKGAVLIVSHNRYLLDRVADGILHLENGRVKAYVGNYSTYRATVLREKIAQQADYVADQRRLAQLEEVLRRFREIAHATASPAWGKKVRAKQHQLEREREQATDRPVAEQGSIRFKPRTDASKADIAVQVRDYSRGYDGLSLFEDAEMEVSTGERAALIGPNGCGKTTLLRDLMEHGSWDGEALRIGPSLRVGYCAQSQEVLDERRTVLETLTYDGALSRQQASNILAQFLFRPNDFDKKVSSLSGGERNRLQLANVLIKKPNLLVLDEPTNHLDIPAREAVEDLLTDFKGTILLVSHDRYLLDKIASRVIEVRDRKLEPFEGNFSEFWAERRAVRSPQRARVATRRTAREERKDGALARSVAPQAPASSNGEDMDALSAAIAAAEEERAALERRMAAAFTEGDHREGQRLGRELEKQTSRLDDLYAKWERAVT